MKKPEPLPLWIQHMEREYGSESVRIALQEVYKKRLFELVERTSLDMNMQDFTALVRQIRGTK